MALRHQSFSVFSQPVPRGHRGDHCSLSRCTHHHQDWRRGKGRPVLIAGEASKKRLVFPSNASMSRWPRLNRLASLTSVVETIPEKASEEVNSGQRWQRLLPFFPSLFLEESAALPVRSRRHCLSQCLACPACQPGPPQSSVPWHAGALWSPRSLLSLKGPLAFPSTPGALGCCPRGTS